MHMSISKFTQVVASVTVLATAIFTLPAAAAVHRPELRGRTVYRSRHRYIARPLTVTRRFHHSPFHGPAAIITAPVAVAGMAVGLPFRALATIFPARGNPARNPLVLIGAPLDAAGKLAQLPFYVVDAAFGAPPAYY